VIVNKAATAEIKQQLIQTADDMFMRLGIKSVSMDDIAREMGVSKKTIYQMVDGKKDLLTLVIEQDACKDMEVIQANHEQSRDAIDEFLRNSRYFIRQMRDISPATMRDLQKYYPDLWKNQMAAHHDEFRRTIQENLERGMEEGLYRDDIDSEIVTNFYVGMMFMIIDTSVFPAKERTIVDIIRQHGKYHLNGIVNQFGQDRVDEYLRQESLD